MIIKYSCVNSSTIAKLDNANSNDIPNISPGFRNLKDSIKYIVENKQEEMNKALPNIFLLLIFSKRLPLNMLIIKIINTVIE